MKSEFLEPLLADRALGELSPEVAALLDVFLAQNPAAAAHAATFGTALHLARTAVAAPPGEPAALDLDRLRRAQPASPRLTHRREIFRLAACVALGLGLGWLLRAGRQSPLPSPAASIAAFAPPAVPLAATHFWSVARFAPELAKSQPQKSL